MFTKDDITLTFQIFDAIEITDSTNDKIELLEELKDNKFAKWFLQKALDTDITFGILPNSAIAVCTLPTDINYFVMMLNAFEQRIVTGNKAKDMISDFFNNYCNTYHAKWFYRLLRKDLCLGMDKKTVNKAIPKLVKEFSPQLCEHIKIHNNNGVYTLSEKVFYPNFASPKLDGMRVVIAKINNEISVYSRTGKSIYNIDHIINDISKYPSDIVLDGELKASNWNETVSISKTKDIHPDALNLKYNVFDIIPTCEWINKNTTVPFAIRYEYLKHFNENKNSSHIDIIEHIQVNDEYTLINYFTDCLANKHEGIVIKNPYAPYVFDRDKSWVAIKLFHSIDLKVIGFTKYETNKPFVKYKGNKYNPADLIGSFIVDFNGVEVKVGSGLTINDRINLKNIIGKIIEIEYADITQDGSLKNPTFLRVREDK